MINVSVIQTSGEKMSPAPKRNIPHLNPANYLLSEIHEQYYILLLVIIQYYTSLSAQRYPQS